MDTKQSKKRKCEQRSIEFKNKVLLEVERGIKSKAKIAEEYSVNASTLSTWIKNKQQIFDAHKGEKFESKRKRLREANHEDLENALHKWFMSQRSKNVPISGPILQAKAHEFAEQLGYNDFKCSTGWLSRFQTRHNITFRKVCGEAKSVDMTKVHDWHSEVLMDIINEYKAADIYNANETAIFWKLLPDRTLTFRSDDLHGSKISKERVSVMVCANMDGSDKVPLLVIGKSAKPRCFKNALTLPTQYTSNKNAWMTSSVFVDWIRKFDENMDNAGRKVVLLVDNCPSHPDVQDLKATTLVFLPPNTTSVTQPMDQGVIRNLKVNYRRQLVRKLSNSVENSMEYSVSLLDALHFLRTAWDAVTPETIANCFMRIVIDNVPPAPTLAHSEPCEMDTTMFAEYVSIDDTAVCNEEVTDASILDSVREAQLDPAESEPPLPDDITERKPRKTSTVLNELDPPRCLLPAHG